MLYAERLSEMFTLESKNCNNDNVSKFRECIKNYGYSDLLLPEWLLINIVTNGDNSNYGYWTNTLLQMSPEYIWTIIVYNTLLPYTLTTDNLFGIRPVIHISIDNVIQKLESPEYVNPNEVGGEISGGNQ